MSFIILFFVGLMGNFTINAGTRDGVPSMHGGRTYHHGLYFKKYPAPEKVPKAVVILTHGILEHGLRYRHFIQRLNKYQFTVYTYDLRGHGHSFGVRAHISDFNHYIDDLASMVDLVKEREKDAQIYLYGHSMGGLITFLYLAQMAEEDKNIIKGVVLSSPGINIPVGKIEKVKLFFAKYLKKVNFFSKIKAHKKIDPHALTEDHEMLKKHREDLLIEKDFTISLGHELITASKKAAQMAKAIDPMSLPPLFFIQGDQDTIVDAQKNIELAHKLVNSETTPLIIEGGLHELINGKPIVRNLVMDKILRFYNANAFINALKSLEF